ncbi:transcriptional regulator, partial [Pelistega indica]
MHQLPININDLLANHSIESERIEYKEGWNPESILHTICAFANDFYNLGGGYIVIGVKEKDGIPQLPPVGLRSEQIDVIQKELVSLEKNAIQPSFNTLTATYNIQGKLILVLWVVGGEVRPYKAKKSLGKENKGWAYYIRKHTSTVVATGADEQELISLANSVPFDDRLQIASSLDDLEPHLIREFLTEIKSDLAKEAKSLSVIELGQRMNIIGGTAETLFPKNVGLMFFNSTPERFFPYSQIEVVYFPDGTGGNQIDEKVFKGPVGRIVQDALIFIKNLYLKERIHKLPDQAESKRFFNFPFEAIEEALVNAVYHRSYEIREPIEVRIERTGISILSYPGPDRSISLDKLQLGKAVSRRYRNRRIGEFLKELDLTEGRSTGIPKILRVMMENGSPEPIFETDDERSYFLIHLPIHADFLDNDERSIQDTPQD